MDKSLFPVMDDSPSPALARSRHDEAILGGVVAVCGADGSPYTQKVLTALRYRRIPHRFLLAGSPEDARKPEPSGPKLLPKVIFGRDVEPAEVMGDSTFILKELERRYSGSGRSLYPCNPGMALLADVFEDFCDEWMTKAMYHYRWTYDSEAAAYGIATSQAPACAAVATQIETFVRQRQVGRLSVVGSNATTSPAIEESFARVIQLFAAHLDSGFAFLFGARPSSADFAFYGQLHPMVLLDPNVSAKVFAISQRVWFWVHSMKDLSGLSLREEEGGWLPQDETPLPPTLMALLQEVGRMYVPFMTANERAINSGQKEVSVKVDNGRVTWEQPSFKYQAKCVRWLREGYAALPCSDRSWVDHALLGTGCLDLLSRTAKDVPQSRL